MESRSPFRKILPNTLASGLRQGSVLGSTTVAKYINSIVGLKIFSQKQKSGGDDCDRRPGAENEGSVV